MPRERELTVRCEDADLRLAVTLLDDERRLGEVHLPGDGLHRPRIEMGAFPHHRELVAGERPLREYVDDRTVHGRMGGRLHRLHRLAKFSRKPLPMRPAAPVIGTNFMFSFPLRAAGRSRIAPRGRCPFADRHSWYRPPARSGRNAGSGRLRFAPVGQSPPNRDPKARDPHVPIDRPGYFDIRRSGELVGPTTPVQTRRSKRSCPRSLPLPPFGPDCRTIRDSARAERRYQRADEMGQNPHRSRKGAHAPVHP